MAYIVFTKSRFKFSNTDWKFWRILKKCFTEAYLDENVDAIPCEIQSKPKNKEFKVVATQSDGREMVITSGKLAKLANGCATVTLNDSTVMATTVCDFKNSAPNLGFVPLTVSFHQKAAALGRIPLNFLRREIGQSETEILTSRMIDRSIRPLFPKGFNAEVQIICNPMALDGNNFPDVLSINAASTALTLSNIPWDGPVAAVRVGIINDNIIINPDKKQLNESTLNLIVASKAKHYIVMLESVASSILLPSFMKAIKAGSKECQIIIQAIQNLKNSCGKPKMEFTINEPDFELTEKVKSLSTDKLKEIFQNHSHDKYSRDSEVMELHNSVMETLKRNGFETPEVSRIFYEHCKNIFRDLIFETNIRCDGRSLNMIRNIECEVDLFKPLHGSALFQRGQTQVFCSVALDSPNSAMKMDRVSMMTSGLKEKNFFVHYEFPPFATNEVKRIGPIGRREIGHGALAEKALKFNIPDNYPFTIRLTSEVLESNGSSSMATVCGGSLALMDAGVPIKNACAGVAIGVITRPSNKNPSEFDYKILTDILGIEDYYGDMDFKIAGTKKHITAAQLDVKTQGMPLKIIMSSLAQAKTAISSIIKVMNSACSQPRTTSKLNMPVMEKVNIPAHLRSQFIGLGGVNLKRLEMDVGVEIMEGNPGEFNIFAPNKTAMDEATTIIKNLMQSKQEPTLEFGGIYTATIVEIKEHGCLVTLYPQMQPVLIHMSQLDYRKVAHPSALGMEVGHEIQVKYFGRDPVSGTMRLSRKVLQTTASEVVQSYFKKSSEHLEQPTKSERNV